MEVVDIDEDGYEIVPADHPQYAGMLMDADHQDASSVEDKNAVTIMIGDAEVEFLRKENKPYEREFPDLTEAEAERCLVPYQRSIGKPKRQNKTLVLDKDQLMRLTKRLGGKLEVPPNVTPRIDQKTQQIRMSGVNLVFEQESIPYL